MAEKIRYEKKRIRLTEEYQQPSESLIWVFMDIETRKCLMRFEKMLREWYDVGREIGFPFGNEYDWSFRYSHKKSLLLYVFFEEGGFCCTISINNKGAQEVDSIFDKLLPEVQTSWLDRYVCGADSDRLNRSVIGDEELSNLIRLAGVKVKPKKIEGKDV